MLSLSTIANGNLAFAMSALQSVMDIREVRRLALRRLIDNAPEKTISAFAERHSVDATYVSQLLNGHRKMGEKSARNMEEKLSLEKGELDRLDGDAAILLVTAPTISAVPASPPPKDSWPFKAPRAMFDALSPSDRAQIDATVSDLIEVRFARTAKTKTGS